MSSVLKAIRDHLQDLEEYITFLEAENESYRKVIEILTSNGTERAKITDGINGDAERELP